MIIRLNGALADANLHYKLHYLNDHEAALDPLGHCACEGKDGEFESFVKMACKTEGFDVFADWETFRLKVISL